MEKGRPFFSNGMQTLNIKGMMELENHQWILELMGKSLMRCDIFVQSQNICSQLNLIHYLRLVSGLGKKNLNRSKGHLKQQQQNNNGDCELNNSIILILNFLILIIILVI